MVSGADCCMSYGLSSNPGEGMDVCECIVPLWHETLNNRRATSPSREVCEKEGEGEIPDSPSGCLPQKLGWNQPKSYCQLYGAQSYR
ncbi:hypothetical protein TNCV_4774341 [Trichonephila clavipes]|nr:hypothetical protein TNCV_4774341 [Trichonephila clavipes]